MAVRQTKAEWAEIVEAFKNSGQTQVDFCRKHGLNAKTLGFHVRGSSEQKQKKRSSQEWSVLIDKQKSSGMSRLAWCKANGINEKAMRTAERRLLIQSQMVSGPKWIELGSSVEAEVIATTQEKVSCGVRILGKNLEIEISSEYPVEKLAALIGKLVNLC